MRICPHINKKCFWITAHIIIALGFVGSVITLLAMTFYQTYNKIPVIDTNVQLILDEINVQMPLAASPEQAMKFLSVGIEDTVGTLTVMNNELAVDTNETVYIMENMLTIGSEKLDNLTEKVEALQAENAIQDEILM